MIILGILSGLCDKSIFSVFCHKLKSVSCRKEKKIARSLFSRKVPRICCRYLLRPFKIPTINFLLGTSSQKLTKIRRSSLGLATELFPTIYRFS